MPRDRGLAHSSRGFSQNYNDANATPPRKIFGAVLLLWSECQLVLTHLFDASSVPWHWMILGIEPGFDKVGVMLTQEMTRLTNRMNAPTLLPIRRVTNDAE
ncbi:MAG: hypothetical protein RI985_858 [Chloroflexota bacterium]